MNISPATGFGVAAVTGASTVIGPVIEQLSTPVGSQLMHVPETVEPSLLNLLTENSNMVNQST